MASNLLAMASKPPMVSITLIGHYIPWLGRNYIGLARSATVDTGHRHLGYCLFATRALQAGDSPGC